MASVRKRPLWSVIVRSKITFLVVLALCVFFAMSVYERFTIERDMAARRMDAEVELRALETRATELGKKVEYLSAEQGVEAELRKQFDVARAGEQVVVIVEGNEPPRPEEGGGDETKKSFWSRFFPW